MTNTQECPICKSKSDAQVMNNRDSKFFACPVCGRFEYGEDDSREINENHLSSYLFYHAFYGSQPKERRYHATISKEACDAFRKKAENSDVPYRMPVHMDSDIVEAWYPKSFAERVDDVLLYIFNHTEHMGKAISLSFQGMLSLLFVDRKEQDRFSGVTSWRDDEECRGEAKYLLDYLEDNALISYNFESLEQKIISLTLTPKGYSRVYEIQKATSHGRNVLVAMKFGNDTKLLREAIRSGIYDAHYNAVFIDEVQHNDFITPELLKQIRDSKFVVVDLTHNNNGAYFEEGYAMGVGKPVIQLCQKDTQLHFDIAQKNTIMWETEDDIPLRLTNRIKATID